MWEESLDAIASLAAVLRAAGHACVEREGDLVLPGPELVVIPGVVDGVQPLEDGAVSTVTTVELHHMRLLPRGVFEYQHATGDSTEASLRRGFEEWVRVDLVPILDALRDEPTTCSSMLAKFPAAGDRPPRGRRAVLGPLSIMRKEPPQDGSGSDGHDPFCPCCFLTRSSHAFRELVTGEETVAIRFFGMRMADGSPGADCRVNGTDYEAGKEALCAYVGTWPGKGVEFRKQYVVIHNFDRPAT
jgi:hypothetical protein